MTSLYSYPPRVRTGDTIGLLTPSAPAAGRFPRRYARGIDQLERMGFKVREARHTTAIAGHVSASAQERVEDLHEMFEDPDVRAIVSTLGGGHTCQMLPHIDWSIIQANPKPFVGYSDITVLHHAIGTQTQMVTYYGPTLMTEFAEYPSMPRYSAESFIDALCLDPRGLHISPTESVAIEQADWAAGEETPRVRAVGSAVPSIVVRPGTVTGTVTGGCIESLERLRGTTYWPSTHGAILLLETSSENVNLLDLEIILSDYQNMGVLESIAGLVFGRKQWDAGSLERLFGLLESATMINPIPTMIGFRLRPYKPHHDYSPGCRCHVKHV